MRRQIGQRLRLRRTPELDFTYDESIEQQDRIEQLLQDIAGERRRAVGKRAAIPAMKDKLLAEIREAIGRGQRFVISSHARPDGDAIGSQLAMALALRAMGKTVSVVAGIPRRLSCPPFRVCTTSRSLPQSKAISIARSSWSAVTSPNR